MKAQGKALGLHRCHGIKPWRGALRPRDDRSVHECGRPDFWAHPIGMIPPVTRTSKESASRVAIAHAPIKSRR